VREVEAAARAMGLQIRVLNAISAVQHLKLSIFVMPERPHPRRTYGRRVYLEDAANNRAVG